jgi:hypothetical protein
MATNTAELSISGTDIFKDMLNFISRILKDERCPDEWKDDIHAIIRKDMATERKKVNERC